MTLATGTVIQNRYRVVKLIGQGGMGAVYRAWDLNLNCRCALKENFDSSVESAQQFAYEASILANLRHPNLPRVTNHFVIPGQGQYLVMDFVEGEDLQTKLDHHGALPENQAVDWIKQIADALTYLHSRTPSIIHRDIKPHNIIITPDGTATLVDFGIAKMYDPTTKTFVAARAVTEGYSPYEQYGNGRTDARSDVYALGATLYTLLTNTVPPESIQRISNDTLVPPRSLNPNISPLAERAILRAMSVTPQQRFQSAREFRDALDPGLATQRALPSQPTQNRNIVTPTAMASPQIAPITISHPRPGFKSNSTPVPISKPISHPVAMPNVEYASWGRRAVAYLIDGVLLYVLGICINLPLSVMTSAMIGTSSDSSVSAVLSCLSLLVSLGTSAAYYIGMIASSGQTLGKKAMQIRVVAKNGDPVSVGQAVARFIGYYISMLMLYIGFLWPLWDDQKQAIHDKIAGTIVIRA